MNYAFDPTGSSTDNLVSAQRYPVNTSTGASFYIFPQNAPFYKLGFSATYLSTTGEVRTLIEGVDFSFFLEMKGASSTAPNPIYGGIRLLNSTLYGNIDLSYQALGGKFYVLQRQVLDYSRDNDFNSLVAFAALVPYPDQTYPGTTEVIVVDSPTALAYMVGLNTDVAMGMKYLPLPADSQVFIDEGVVTGATGAPEPIPVVVVGGSSGGSGGGVTDGATVNVEGGNTYPVVVQGSVNAAIIGAGLLGQEATLQRVANALEAQDLPHNYALENGGNLASVASASGTQTDSAYAGSGTSTIIGALKGIYAKLAGALNIRALSSATDSVTTVPSGTQAMSTTQLPSTLGQKTAAGSASVVLASDQPPVTVQGPAGAALATSTNVGAVATAVAAIPAVAELLFVDDSATAPAFYIRRETVKADNSKVTDWFDLDGNVATPNTSLLKAAYSTVGDATLTTQYKATASGSGYNVDDVLARVLVVRSDAGSTKLMAEAWINQTASTKLPSTPPTSNYTLLQQQVTFDTSALATAAKQAALHADGGSLSHVTNFPATQTIAGTLTANIGTTGGLALDSSIQTLIGAVRATISVTSTMWVDLLASPTAYYIRREALLWDGSKTVVWEDVNGDEVTPVISNLTPYGGTGGGGGSGVDVTRADTDSTLVFEATAAGTGYASGDMLVNVFGMNIDPATPAVVYNVWVNYGPSVTSPTLLTAPPTSGTYQPKSQSVTIGTIDLPVGAATETGNLATIATAAGAPSDGAYGGTGAGSIISTLKGIYARLGSNLSIRNLTAATDIVKVEGGNTAAVKVDGSAVTQPVSAASLPLPSGAATETGNLSVIATATGTQTDAAYSGGASGSVIGILKSLYTRLGGTLNTRVLTASDVVTIQGGNTTAVKTDGSATTQPVSAASLPLPTGAATETGNLASINTNTGAKADGAWSGAGDGTIISVLKRISNTLAGVLNIRNLSSSTDSITIQGGNSTAVKTDGSATTQPVSAVSLPLPTNAATETGNLAAIAAATGVQADVAYGGSGAAGMVALLKGIYAKLGATLSIRALTSATDTVKVEGGNSAAIKVDGSATTQPVSVSTLPLPAGAAIESGNLATIATNTNTTALNQGAVADAAWSGTGNGSVIAVLKSVYNAIKGTLNTRALTSGTDSVTIQGGNTTAVKVDGSGVTQPVSGTMTANIGLTNGLALDSSIQALTNAVKATIGITGSVWVDNTVTPNVYYVRREKVNEGTGVITIEWTLTDGTVVTPVVANLMPTGDDANISVLTETYTASAGGTGYASGDILIHCYAVDSTLAVPKLVYSIWFNAGPSVTSGTILSAAPTDGTYAKATQAVSVTALPLPTGAAKESGGYLQSVATAAGASTDSGWTGTGTATLIALLKGVYTLLSGSLAIRSLSSATDSVTIQGGNSQAVKVDGSTSTQPISAVALPLPTGAATETGNLAAINTAIGAKADVSWSTGAGSVISVLKTVADRLASALNIRQLTSATDSVTVQGGNSTAVKTDGSAVTQPVSATALPLPANASKETGGNLAAISTATGSVSDVAFNGVGTASVVAVLKGIYATLISSLNIRALTAATDTVTVQGGNSTAVKTDGSAVTQPVSAATLPLPTGAATETGNLASINTAIGATADAVYAGTGDASIVAALKGVYAKLAAALNIRNLTSARDTVKVEGGNATAVVVDGSAVTQPVSVSALPLPAGAATESGNLATISATQGAVADAAYVSGSGTVVAVLKGIFGKLSGTLNIRALTAADVVTIQGGNATAVKTDGSATTQPVSATALPLPAGAATESGNLATIATTQGAVGDVAYVSGSGSAIAVLKGIFGKLSGSLNIRALTAADVVTIQGGNATAVKTDGSATTQPISATALPLPTGAATEAGNLATINTKVTNSDTVQGAVADVAYAGSGSSTVVAALKGIYAAIKGTLAIRALTAADVVTIQGGNSTAVKTDGSAVTQPVSATALPLPTGAATETGNLATIATKATSSDTVQGAVADVAYAGSGSGTVIAILKGLYARLAGTLSVSVSSLPSLPAGANAIGSVSVSNFPSSQQVSATSLPLPTGAATETGNLATIAANSGTTNTKITQLATAFGTVSDPIWDYVSANPTNMALQKAIVDSLHTFPSMTWKIDGGNAAAVNVAATQLPASLGQKAMSASLSVTMASDQPPRNVTSTGGSLALDSSIQTLINTIKATVDISGTVWYDKTTTPAVYYVRRESVNQGTGVITISWENLDGTAASPTVANLIAVNSNSDIETQSQTYTAIAAGTGYVSGDVLIHVFGINATASPPSLSFSIWFNAGPSVANGAILSVAPTSGTYQNSSASSVSVTSSVLPANAAMESGGVLTSIDGSLVNVTNNTFAISSGVGAQADASWSGTGNGTLVALLKAVHALITTTNTSVGNQTTTAWTGTGNGNLNGVLKAIYNKLIGTLAITATSLPLPTGAAQETGGNLATIATETTDLHAVTGTAADVAYSGTGAGTVVAVLKGIYTRLGGSMNIRALTAATDTVTVQGGNSTAVKTDGSAVVQPVSATALPLPTGAATETGNLATIATNTGSSATALGTINTSNTAMAAATGTTADAAWNGATGTKTIIGLLLGVYNTLTTSLTIRPLTAATDTVTVQGGNATAVKVDGSATTQPVSATALPLPAGAATESGNLATIALEATDIHAVAGTPADAAYAGTGNSSLMAALKGMYALTTTTNNSLGAASVAAWTGTGNGTINAVLKAIYNKLFATVAITATSLPLPTGAASETGNLATINTATNAAATTTGTGTDAAYAGTGSSTLVGLLKGIYTVLTTTLSIRPLTAATDTVTVQGGNATAVKVDGSAVTQPVSFAALPLPAGAATETGNLAAISAGIGAPTDVAFGTGSGSVIAVLKGIFSRLGGSLNIRALTATDVVTVQGGNATAVKTDSSATTQPVSATALPLPTGAATEGGNLSTILTRVTAANTNAGSNTDVAWGGTGNGTMNAVLKALYGQLAAALTVNVSSLPSLPAGANAIGSVTVSNLPATQAVSAAALPLPAGAATEAGNLATINTSTAAAASSIGSVTDTSWTGTGNGTLVSILKKVSTRLGATLDIAAASLPLPTGAATETGNLATLVTSNSAINANAGAIADAAWAGSGSGTLNAIMKAVYGKLAATLTVNVAQMPALTKGTQSANGVMTQDLHDAGRNVSTLFMPAAVLNTATETLVSLTGYKSGAAVAATTTPAVVTTGKTLRLTRVSITYVGTATIGYVAVKLRANTGGVVAVTSPLVETWTVGAVSATAGNNTHIEILIPEGMEFAAGTGIGITVQGFSATSVAAAVGYTQLSLYGYEY